MITFVHHAVRVVAAVAASPWTPARKSAANYKVARGVASIHWIIATLTNAESATIGRSSL
jgi:hypothetical protein